MPTSSESLCGTSRTPARAARPAPCVVDDLEVLESNGTGGRVARVGEAVDETAVGNHELADLLADNHGAQRNVAARNSLRGVQEVRLEIPLLRPEPRPRAPVPRHDF